MCVCLCVYDDVPLISSLMATVDPESSPAELNAFTTNL